MEANRNSMRDQAEVLRRLVEHQSSGTHGSSGGKQLVVVVAGGKGGVGTTTMAVSLATLWSRRGERVVLVDADWDGADVASMCRIEPRPGVLDVLAGRAVSEVLHHGPAGVKVLPGPSTVAPKSAALTQAGFQRMLAAVKDDEVGATRIVIDAGHAGGSQWPERVQSVAGIDELILVTTADPAAIMNTYGVVKRSGSKCGVVRPTRYILNMASAAGDAEVVHARFSQSCWRFLRVAMPLVGTVPVDPAVVAAARMRNPVVLESPRCPAARAIGRLIDELEQRPGPERAEADGTPAMT